LTAKHPFHCGLCNQGFVRYNNLEVHRRKHNLAWQLSKKEEPREKKVYVCPVPKCVHHVAERALSDLTAIKRHFVRRHGSKTLHCPCGRSYAVRSDFKSHEKICRYYPNF
jgi:hypothetical protein